MIVSAASSADRIIGVYHMDKVSGLDTDRKVGKASKRKKSR
jgi:hypothetical protein